MQEEKLYSGADKNILFKLWKYAKPYLWQIILTFVLLILISSIEIFLPIITKTVVDKYIERSHIELAVNDETMSIARKHKDYAVIDSASIYIPRDILKKEEQTLIREKHYIINERNLLFNKDEHIRVLDKYNILYVTTAKGVFVPYDELKDISKDDIKQLRSNDLNNIRKYAFIYIGLLLITFVFTYFQVIMMALVSENVMFDIRSDVIKSLLSLSINYFRKNPIGRLVTRSTNDVDALRELLTDVFIYSAKDVIVVVGIFIIMFRLSPQLALIIMLLLPIIGFMLYLFQKYAREAYRKVRITLARVNSFLSEAISGVSLIKTFNQQDKTKNDFYKTSTDYYKANMFQLLIFSIFRPLIDVLAFITLAVLIYFGGNEVMKGALSIGVLIAFISYIQMLFRPIFDFSEKYNIFQSAMASSERILLILEEEDKIHSPKIPHEPERMNGKVEFRNVTFAYKADEPVLKDVSFEINPNESVAFVGATGAGKTTIINLLMRFYDIEEGEILIDGVNIKHMDLDFLRNYFGLVLQDVFMFSGDITYNIALNREMAENKLIEYSKYVNAHTFIQKLEDQYRNEVSESGKNLSTGQRQLIAFARALAKEPRILILDEATSSIDSETENLIQDAIKRIMHDRTSIAIAHRLSTIQDADRIYVLHKGRIVEQGNHLELLSLNGKYSELYKYQYIE